MPARSWPSSSTRPPDGLITPASARSKVVFPEPLGPRIPTKLSAGISIVTPRSTGARPGYAKTTSAACSNAQPSHRAASESGEAEHLLVLAVEQVLDASVHLELARDAPRRARVPDVVALRVEQPAECAVRRFDRQHATPAAAADPADHAPARDAGIDGPVMPGTVQERLA